MPDLPDDVARIVRQAAPGGTLQFGGDRCNWTELSEWSSAPREGGVYALGFKLGIRYELAVSRILYIGSTVNLRSRLQTYCNGSSHITDLELLKHRYANGLVATWITLPGLSEGWLRAMEDAALQEASRKLGSYPALNRGRIDSPDAERCRGLIRIVPCDGLPLPRPLQLLGEQLGSKTLGKLVKPRPLEDWKDKIRMPAHLKVTFTGVSQPELPAAEQARTEEPDIERLTWITDDHVAAWDVAKMRQVVAICKSLTEIPKRGKTTVRTFVASTGQTPRPHTWGEVALVQGRIVAGTWLPRNRLWIKIVHGKELLGQAIFDKGMIDGRDKSELPQTRERPSISESDSWCEEVNAIEGRLPADFLLPADETRGIDTSQFPEHVKLLSGSHAMDVEWARFCALDRDKWHRVREIIIGRIERTFSPAVQAEGLVDA